MMNDRSSEKLTVYFHLNLWFTYVSDPAYKNKQLTSFDHFFIFIYLTT